MILDNLISSSEIEKRKQLMRDITNYELDNCDHIPILITYFPNTMQHTLTEVYTNREIQLEYELDKIRNTLKHVPDDYIPSFKTDLGYVVSQTVFRMKPIYSESKKPAKYPDQAPYMDPGTKPINNIKEMYEFTRPDNIFERGLVPEGLERIKYIMKNTNYEIPTSCLDIGTGLLMAYELMETNLFFTTMKDDPKAINHVTDILTDVIIDLADKIIEVAGGIKNMTSTEWDEKWFPEDKRCYISSEMQVLYSPDEYKVFDLPYCSRQFKHFGPGFIHNCGPQTAIDHFWNHDPKPYGITCEYYSDLSDYHKIKEVFLKEQRKAILLVDFINIKNLEEMGLAFENLKNIFAPEIIVIPCMWVGPVHICQDEPEKIYNKLLPISKDYMNRVKEGLNS